MGKIAEIPCAAVDFGDFTKKQLGPNCIFHKFEFEAKIAQTPCAAVDFGDFTKKQVGPNCIFVKWAKSLRSLAPQSISAKRA